MTRHLNLACRHGMILLLAFLSVVTSSVVPATNGQQSRIQQVMNQTPQQVRAKRFSEDSHMPSLFNEDEEDVYDKYAACLAATEGLRRIREEELKADAEKHQQGTSEDESSPAETEKQINTKYARSSTGVLRAMGMPVSKFNELGRAIAGDPQLKKKVSKSDEFDAERSNPNAEYMY